MDHQQQASPSYTRHGGTQLEVDVSRDGALTRIAVRGEIDLATADGLRRQLASAMSTPRVEIDLAGVTFMDSTGLAVLLDLYRALGQCPEAMVLRSPNPAVRRILEITGVDRHVVIA